MMTLPRPQGESQSVTPAKTMSSSQCQQAPVATLAVTTCQEVHRTAATPTMPLPHMTAPIALKWCTGLSFHRTTVRLQMVILPMVHRRFAGDTCQHSTPSPTVMSHTQVLMDMSRSSRHHMVWAPAQWQHQDRLKDCTHMLRTQMESAARIRKCRSNSISSEGMKGNKHHSLLLLLPTLCQQCMERPARVIRASQDHSQGHSKCHS